MTTEYSLAENLVREVRLVDVNGETILTEVITNAVSDALEGVDFSKLSELPDELLLAVDLCREFIGSDVSIEKSMAFFCGMLSQLYLQTFQLKVHGVQRALTVEDLKGYERSLITKLEARVSIASQEIALYQELLFKEFNEYLKERDLNESIGSSEESGAEGSSPPSREGSPE